MPLTIANSLPALPIPPAPPRSLESAVVPAAAEPVQSIAQAEPKKGRMHQQVQELKKVLQSLSHIGMGRQRMLFIQNIGLMLTAGLSLVESLQTQLIEARSKPMKKLIDAIVKAVESGTPFWKALDEQALFSPYEIALVRIGEEGGNLAQNMEYLTVQQEKDRSLKQKVKMAMIYPTIVLTMVFVLVIGLGLFVLPNLVGVLLALNVKLPLATRVVIALAKFFEAYGTVVAPLLILVLINILLLAKFTRFRVVAQWVVFHTPGIGSLAREATIAQFGVILGGLLKAGVPLTDALSSLVNVTHIEVYRRFYVKLLEHVSVGDSFSKSFAALPVGKILPFSVQQLIVTGEKSGMLAEVLLRVADMYDKKASETAEKLPVVLEPLLLLMIGGIVAGIAFAVIVPIYSVVGNIGH